MEAAAGGGVGFGERVGGRDVGSLHDEAGARQSVVDVLAFAVNRRIDLVGHAVVAFVALEADVMRGRDAPQRAAIHQVRRFPRAQVIARHRHAHRLGVRESIILRPVEQKKSAHRHGQVIFFLQRINQRVDHRVLHGTIHLHPAGSREHLHDLLLLAHDQDVDHVSRLALRVGNSPRNFFKDRRGDGWNRSFRRPADGHRRRRAQSWINDLDFDLEVPLGAFRVAQALIDSQEQPSRHGRLVIDARADGEWLGAIIVAESPHQRAVPRIAHRVLVNQILKRPRESIRTERLAVGMLLIRWIVNGALGGEAQLFSSAQINFCVYPLFGSVQINLVGSDVGGA